MVFSLYKFDMYAIDRKYASLVCVPLRSINKSFVKPFILYLIYNYIYWS